METAPQQDTVKTPWIAPSFERTALQDAAYQVGGQYIDGTAWESRPV